MMCVLKSFFAKVIETPELQHEAKKLLKGGGETCTEILDLIHSDYRVQDIGERMQDSVTTCYTSRRSKTSDEHEKSTTKSGGGGIKGVNYPFLNSIGNLLPLKYYPKFKAWYFSMMKPVESCSNAEKQLVTDFKFKFDTPYSWARTYRYGTDHWRTHNCSFGQYHWMVDNGTSYISNPYTNNERRGGFYKSNQHVNDRISRKKANLRVCVCGGGGGGG